MILDKKAKTPASELTDYLVNAMRHEGILHSKLGRYKNTLKIRPPMPFSIENTDLLFDTLTQVLDDAPV